MLLALHRHCIAVSSYSYIVESLALGLADPGPVAEALWTDEELEAAVHLDAIITVVDAKHIQQQLQQESSDDSANEAQKQIAYADSVLLNKASHSVAVIVVVPCRILSVLSSIPS